MITRSPLKHIFLSFFLFALFYPTHSEAKFLNKKEQKEEIDIYELSIDENISTPELGKHNNRIIEFQKSQFNELNKLDKTKFPYETKLIRNGEVIMITIPARSLFNQNETNLSEKGKDILSPILKFLATKQLYKIVLAMHSDNTGNEIYTMDLTTKRVNSIFDWIGEKDKRKTDYVVPYALGNNDPIVDNNSIINRDRNRRLVIYLIPEKIMINQAKRGKISL